VTTATAGLRHRSGVLSGMLGLVGAALLAAMGWIHLDLWLDGYRAIDVIGPAFLRNTIAGFGLAALLLVPPRALVTGVAAVAVLTNLVVLTRVRRRT
jgi:hypothetical protein